MALSEKPGRDLCLETLKESIALPSLKTGVGLRCLWRGGAD